LYDINKLHMLKAKTFRLPVHVIDYIEFTSRKFKITQGKVIESLVSDKEVQTEKWKNDLMFIENDLEYKKESILMAEEHYE